jgi:hypothetical protein
MFEQATWWEIYWWELQKPQITSFKHLGCERAYRMSRDSSVVIVTDCGLDGWGFIPGRGKGFFSFPQCQTGSEVHPVSSPVGTGGSFRGR